jgi:AAA+ superfamily predicted ATPase
MVHKPTLAELFGTPTSFPDPIAAQRYAQLVGIDDQKTRLIKILSILVNPESLRKWAEKYHPDADLTSLVLRRPPLIVLAGDVGSGKTALAESIGDTVARQNDFEVRLLPLSLAARGDGRVGEMTQLLTAAFEHTIGEAGKFKGKSHKHRGAVLLLLDEADAIVQSREALQMHHEDRAGVNTFIRGIDQMSLAEVPAAVIVCTNRFSAIDPAVRRRAADILRFDRPNDEQRRTLLNMHLSNVSFDSHTIESLVRATGPQRGRDYGYTFSDIVQRLLPTIILDAYPKTNITAKRALEITAELEPTRPFTEELK